MVVGKVGQGAWPDPKPAMPLGKPTYLRRDFTVESTSNEGRIYASAKGLYKLIHRRQSGNPDVFAPGWTDYNKRIQYQTFDVTKLLTKGKHTIGVILDIARGRGYMPVGVEGGQYGRNPMALIQLEMVHHNPLRQTYASNKDWKCATDILDFRPHDGRELRCSKRNQRLGDKPGFDDRKWKRVATEPIGSVPLVAQPDQPASLESFCQVGQAT